MTVELRYPDSLYWPICCVRNELLLYLSYCIIGFFATSFSFYPNYCVGVRLVIQSCMTLFATLWTVVCQAPLSMGLSRQKYWSALPFPSPGDLPKPGVEPGSPAL